MMRYSFSIYEALALSQIFGTKIGNNSPLQDFFEELPLTPSVEKNIQTVKSRILAEASASKALEQIFVILDNPERLYTVFVKTKSNIQVLNFFEKSQKIVSSSYENQVLHLDSTLNRDELTNFVSTQIGETTDNGTPMKMSLDSTEFLVLSAASALSRSCSKDEITNLLGDASFTKQMILSKLSAAEELVGVNTKMNTSPKNEKDVIKAADLLIKKGVLICSQSGSNELTIDERFTEITNVLGSPDLLVVVCVSDFGSGLRCFSFVKSWDNEIVSLIRGGNQMTDSFVTVERHFSSDLTDYVENSLFNLFDNVTKPNSLKKGQQLIQAGKFNDAVKFFHETLRLTPKDSDVWYWLGVSYHRINLLFDAIRCYTKAVNLNSNDPKAWFDLGRAQYQMKEYSEAAKCFVKITQINPRPHDAWFWAGLSFGNYGEFALAREHLSEAAHRNPNDPQIWYSLGQASVEVLNQSQNQGEAKKMAKNTLRYFKNAEANGIKKIISEDNHSHLRAQIHQLKDFLAN